MADMRDEGERGNLLQKVTVSCFKDKLLIGDEKDRHIYCLAFGCSLCPYDGENR